MKLREFILLFLTLSILFAFGQVSAQAKEVRIERDGSIQRAINNAKAGDSIVLMPGLYRER